jgi:hypothetical protein
MRRLFAPLLALAAGCGPDIRMTGGTEGGRVYLEVADGEVTKEQAQVSGGFATPLLATDGSAPDGARPLVLSSAGFASRVDLGFGVDLGPGLFLPVRFEGGRAWIGLPMRSDEPAWSRGAQVAAWILQDGSIRLVPESRAFGVSEEDTSRGFDPAKVARVPLQQHVGDR